MSCNAAVAGYAARWTGWNNALTSGYVLTLLRWSQQDAASAGIRGA